MQLDLPRRDFTSYSDMSEAWVIRYQIEVTDAAPGTELQNVLNVVLLFLLVVTWGLWWFGLSLNYTIDGQPSSP